MVLYIVFGHFRPECTRLFYLLLSPEFFKKKPFAAGRTRLHLNLLPIPAMLFFKDVVTASVYLMRYRLNILTHRIISEGRGITLSQL